MGGFGISRGKHTTRPETWKRRRKRGPRTADFVRVRETILREAKLFEHRVRVPVLFSGLASEFIGRRFAFVVVVVVRIVASIMGMTRVRFSLRLNNYARLEILDVICSALPS